MNKKEIREIIVTGGTGFIGRNIVPALVLLGYKLCLITRNKKNCANLFSSLPVEIVEWDINHGVPEISLSNPKTLLHLAWQGLPNYNSVHHIEENFINSYSFIKGCINNLGITSVVASGTCLEYGMKSGCLRVDESCDPITSYGLAKHFLHKSLLLLQNEKAFNLAWARLFYMTGKGQSPNSIIPQLDQAIDQNDLYFDMSGGEQVRDYLSIEQVIDDLSTLITLRSNGTFNICSGKPISVRRLVENRIAERRSRIALNLGFYPYLKYEPFSFLGNRNIPEK